MILAMIEDDAAEGVVHAVINVITRFPIAHCFSDDSGNRSGRGGDQEPSRFGQNLEVAEKKSIDFSVDFLRQKAEGLDVLIIGSGKAAANVQDLNFVSPAPCFVHHRLGEIQGLDKILEIGALRTDVKAQAFNHQAEIKGVLDQIHRLARVASEL